MSNSSSYTANGSETFLHAGSQQRQEGSEQGQTRKSKVLIVYSLEAPEREAVLEFAAYLNSYEGIEEPICYHLQTVRHRYFKWLSDQIPHVDAVLCVCTQAFKRDWENESDYTESLKTAMQIKQTTDKKNGYSNFASVVFTENDKQYIPEMLQLNRYFFIPDVDPIAAYVQHVPLCVLRSSSNNTST